MTPELKHQDRRSAACGICRARVAWALLVVAGSRLACLDCDAAIEEIDAACLREFPDPVDVFEDELAERLGLRRHPTLSLNEWRKVRVRYVDTGTAVG